MNSDTRSAGVVDTPQRKATIVAGFMFLFSLLVPILSWTLVLSKLVVAGDVIATANNILANQSLFRIGITIELIMAIGLVVLAVALYIILRKVNQSLALLGLCWKLAEAGIVAVIVLVSFIALQIANGSTSLTAFTSEQLLAPVGIILDAHTTIFSIPMVFLGLDMMVFSYVFFASEYIPRMLAAFGVISFALILIHALMYILAPEYAAMPVNQIVFWAPSGLFEVTIGAWLLIKGTTIPLGDLR